MRFLWGKNLLTKILVFTLIFYLYTEAVSPSPSADAQFSQTQNEAPPKELYWNNVQNSYEAGLSKIIEFFHTMSENLSKINERMTNLETMVKDGQGKLEKKINSDDFFDLIASQNPFQKSTDCGGILKVTLGVPSTIRYPNGGSYRTYERCVWTLLPHMKFASFNIKVHSFGMNTGWDGVIAYFWNSTTSELQSRKVKDFGSWISFPGPYAFITFCSWSEVVGTGFEASIVGLGSSGDIAKFKPFWLTNSSGYFSYHRDNSSMGSNEIVSVVVQPPNYQLVRVSLWVSPISVDTIKFYQLKCHHENSPPNYELVGRSTSSMTFDSSTALYPFLVMYKSNGRSSGLGFTISY